MQESINLCSNQKEYDKVIKKYGNRLIKNWYKENGISKIPYGPALKMLNLLIKVMHETGYIKKSKSKYFHVPLDSYVIVPLRQIINEISECDYAIVIPNTAAMSFILNEEIYDIIQKALKVIASKGRVDPILIDYYCWNETSSRGKKYF